MWFIHGFVLDVVVIGVLPFLSASASDAQRADKCALSVSPTLSCASAIANAHTVSQRPSSPTPHRRLATGRMSLCERECAALRTGKGP